MRCSMRTYRRKNTTKLIVVFCNFAKTPKNMCINIVLSSFEKIYINVVTQLASADWAQVQLSTSAVFFFSKLHKLISFQFSLQCYWRWTLLSVASNILLQNLSNSSISFLWRLITPCFSLLTFQTLPVTWCTNQFNIQQLYALPTLYLCVLYLSENKQRLVPLTA